MTKIAGSYPENEQILKYLLTETSQHESRPTSADRIIDFLKLELVTFDFNLLDDEQLAKRGRAILSYNQKTIAINSIIHPQQVTFSKFHEIAHYVLPQHVKTFYICNAADMSLLQRSPLEQEANEFAADLIYKGDIFTMESNSMPISFDTIIALATKYESSIESTAWRFVKYNFQPCVFVSYEKRDNIWKVKYSIFSTPFLRKHLQNRHSSLTDDNNQDVIKSEQEPSEILKMECKMTIGDEKEVGFACEYFNNTYNVFALIKEQ